MIAYAAEPYRAARDDALIRMHYDEIALHKDAIPLNPDWQRYDDLEAAGALHCFTARDDGTMVGYSVFILSWHLHYNTTRFAANDVLYLHPEYRRGRQGLGLIRFSEQELKSLGVDKVTWHVKLDHDFSPILHRLGYADEEKIVSKLL